MNILRQQQQKRKKLPHNQECIFVSISISGRGKNKDLSLFSVHNFKSQTSFTPIDLLISLRSFFSFPLLLYLTAEMTESKKHATQKKFNFCCLAYTFLCAEKNSLSGFNFINILLAHFLYKSLLRLFSIELTTGPFGIPLGCVNKVYLKVCLMFLQRSWGFLA